jgi:hypothetical protein
MFNHSNFPEKRMTPKPKLSPTTLFDFAEDRPPVTAPTLTLEEALAQVDELKGGDEELKQILRDCYSTHPPTK